MCYRISPVVREALESFAAQRDWKLMLSNIETRKFNAYAFDHPHLAVVTQEKPDTLQWMQWGLIPPFVKTEKEAREWRAKTLNARSEGIFEKPVFRQAAVRRRCLIPVNGFFEFRHIGRLKYPYLVKVRKSAGSGETKVFCLAGLYDSWVNPVTGEIITGFSVITTEANPMMRVIHNSKFRMPVILTGEDEGMWLASAATVAELKNLFRPFDEKLMAAFTVSRDVSKSGELADIAKVMEPELYPELKDDAANIFATELPLPSQHAFTGRLFD
jgi:putative SOS response-associated peptidase YedK